MNPGIIIFQFSFYVPTCLFDNSQHKLFSYICILHRSSNLRNQVRRTFTQQDKFVITWIKITLNFRYTNSR